MNEQLQVKNELMHYGILGMKWGKRSGNRNLGNRLLRGHAGPSTGIGAKRQEAFAKRDIATLDKGGHLSIGLTKTRQAAYDKRDYALATKKLEDSKTNYKNSNLSKKDYKDRKKLDKVLERESGRVYRSNSSKVKNRMAVVKQQQKDWNENTELSKKWTKAFIDGEGSKSMRDFRKSSLDFNAKYAKPYCDAFLKDVGMTKISEVNRQYVYDKTIKARPE